MTESEYNEDELIPPSWLNEDFFKHVLVKCENDKSVKVTGLTITPGSAKGDHYASVIFRAAVTYDSAKSKGNSKSMIVKTIPELEGVKKDLLQQSPLFDTEISMYVDAIPALEAELRKSGDNTQLAANMLDYSLGERKYIVFDDLVSLGYKILKSRMPNLSETKAALLKIAKWHAASYKLAAEGNTKITSYCDSFLSNKNVCEMPFMKSGIEYFIKLVKNDDELKKYAPKLETLKKDLIQNCINIYTSYKGKKNPLEGIFVLCHGDFHCRNMMFKWNKNEELEDLVLFDLQVSFFGSVVADISYALFMLFSEELREKHGDELIYYYSSNFLDALKMLNFQGHTPAIADFFIEILRNRHLVLFLFATFLPMSYGFFEGGDPAEILNSDEARAKLYENPVYVKEVKRVLPYMFHKGYLE